MVTKTDILLIAVAGFTSFSLAWLYFSGNPTETVISLINKVKEFGGGLISKYVEGFKENPLTVLTTTGVAVTTVTGLFYKAYTYLKANSAAQVHVAETKTLEAQASELSVQKKLEETEKELAIYKAEGGGLTKALDINRTLTAENSNLETQLHDLTTRYNTLRTDFEALVNRGDPLKKTA